ncbi:MAG: DNA repair protein RadA [Bacteroidetes bacterium]|nr:DNA repair protein RadA [Bacteroidota bacterium]MCB0802542.1 DNA repair protein RadA [Flavobacteriales bacterium]NOG56617.1 DNA repair protein RadA [Bacteroidota bacterium]
MAKLKKAYFCQNCGAQASKWIGKCPSCNEWNTYVEEIIQKDNTSSTRSSKRISKPILISEIQETKDIRYRTPDNELNRVLGGGLVPGSLVLFGGEPGIGKSTLLLQVALAWSGIKVLYISGEESEQQIKMRAERLGIDNNLSYLLSETSIQNILTHLEKVEADVVVVDSIQTLHSSLIESSAGSISQIRECSGELMRFAKETNTPVFLIGHINKEGSIAGPKVLEHMVDVVLQFEGDRNHMYRLLRSSKNRFGPTNEIGIYEMQGSGLREVANPSEILISNRDEQLSGSAISSSLEGLRPMLIEIQSLVSSAAYGTPQRSSTGFDLRRLNMLLAVLEKRCGFKLGAKDVFLNIAGGIKVEDPAIDLAVVCAVLSSNEDFPIPSKVCFAAEVGLSGEIRPVNKIDQRIIEAQKLGFEKIFISKYNLKGIDQANFSIELIAVSKIEEVFNQLFG